MSNEKVHKLQRDIDELYKRIQQIEDYLDRKFPCTDSPGDSWIEFTWQWGDDER